MRSKAGGALVCFSPVRPAGFASGSPSGGAIANARDRPAYHSTQLQGDERILHALNRFTFGPRPGDLEAVRAMGLDHWFDQQLHPAESTSRI